MTIRKAMVSTLTVFSVAMVGTAVIANQTQPALAKTNVAKVIKTTEYQAKRKVHVNGGWMYTSAKLTHKNYQMTKYLYTKFYATKQVKVRQKNGQTTTLTYLISKNGKVKGYVHATNVQNLWGYGKYSVTAYRKAALTALNNERKQQGLSALKENAKLDRVAQNNSNQMLKSGKKFKVNVTGVSHAGWVFDNYIAPKNNPIIHYETGPNGVKVQLMSS